MQSVSHAPNQKIVKYAVFSGVFLFFVTLIASFPIDIVVKLLQAKKPEYFSQVKLLDVSGSIWHFGGKVQVVSPHLPIPAHMRVFSFDLNWRALSLLAGKLDAVVTLKQPSHLDVVFDFSGSKKLAQIYHFSGWASVDLLSKLSVDTQISAPGKIEVRDFSVRLNLEKYIFESAGGELTWAGGMIALPKESAVSQVQLPALKGKFNILSDGGLAMTVTGQSEHEVYGLVKTLKKLTGVRLGFTNRVMKLAGQPIDGDRLNQMFFEVEQSLLCC